ncbi:discoidin domain-containing protein [Arcticibacter sp.]|uniref:discoidin domain-containing protein n=1 Tax=Arcticibacter sp. TaxID=1872630 RepID=UPI00388E41CF
MKNIKLLAGLLVAASFMTSCKDEVELPDQPLSNYMQIYMPQAVNGAVNKVLNISEEPQVIIYGANYGGQDFPAANINMKFVVDPVLAENYNAVNKTNYEVLPLKSYTLSTVDGVIPAGQLTTGPLKLSILTSGPDGIQPFKTYLLPISISGTDFKVNESLRTTMFTITAQPNMADYPDYDRKNWKIIAFSSEEADGEGPSNGRAEFTLDGNINTFWHSQWKNGNPGPPHFLTVDMGEVKTLHGIAATTRQFDGNGKPNEVKIETSLDNINWVTAGTFNLSTKKEPQKQFLPTFGEARYFRFVVLSAYGSTNVHLAELGAF